MHYYAHHEENRKSVVVGIIQLDSLLNLRTVLIIFHKNMSRRVWLSILRIFTLFDTSFVFVRILLVSLHQYVFEIRYVMKCYLEFVLLWYLQMALTTLNDILNGASLRVHLTQFLMFITPFVQINIYFLKHLYVKISLEPTINFPKLGKYNSQK